MIDTQIGVKFFTYQFVHPLPLYLFGFAQKCIFFRESVSGLRTFLLEQTAAGGDQQVLDYVTDLLNKQVGFLFNERYVNIPAQVGNFLKCILCFKYSYFNFHLEHFIFVLVLYKVGK